MEKTRANYAICDPMTRKKPDYEIDEGLYKELASSGYALLPMFETLISERVLTKHYSLQRNLNLRCRWAEYMRGIESRVFAPFLFPDIRDLHFYNGAVRIHPEASVHLADHRKKLVPGPGVDALGHLPIPQEAMMKRGKVVKPRQNSGKGKQKSLQRKSTSVYPSVIQRNVRQGPHD